MTSGQHAASILRHQPCQVSAWLKKDAVTYVPLLRLGRQTFFTCRMATMKMMKETYTSVTSKPGYHLHHLKPSSPMHVHCQQLKWRSLECLAVMLII